MIEWFQQNWLLVVVPLALFLAFCIIGLWARRVLYFNLDRHLTRSGWGGRDVLIQTSRGPFFFWFVLLGLYVAIAFSSIQDDHKALIIKIIASVFIISIIWLLIILSERLLSIYLSEYKSVERTAKHVMTALRSTLIIIGLLILLDYWGWPLTPLILLIAVVMLVVIIASRDAILNIFSGFEISASRLVKEGDFIKIGSGDAGYVTDMGWRNLIVRTPDQHTIVIPNSKLVRETIVNYGRPLKKTEEPFHFYTRLSLKELTGLKATNLIALVNILKAAPDSIVYYHTHHFLEEFQYLTPEPANDFALWIGDALDNPVLSEKLANIDTFEFTSLGSLKAALISVIEQYMAENPDIRFTQAERDFHFIKVVNVIAPTPYFASDLREFVEVLRKITLDSLYYHVFESRLRLQRRSNDFSVWIRDSFEEDDLAEKIDNLVPYTTTLEGLRSVIIQLIEKRIK
ncbi:MAG: mechanosensitive ion channel family protein [Dehalococcoidia bacterium]|nr:mechanosensitive ion channel family protein [Dehalococcoidia bacterium]